MLFTARYADAQCPDPVEPTFPWISEVPYGDLPTIDVMYRPQFLFSYQPTNEFNAGELPWVEEPSFYCAQNCPCDATPDPGCDVETNGWSVQNECPNLADEPMTEETDWYSTAGPTGTYNCIAYAMGRTDVWLQGNCDQEASAGANYDLTWMNVVARDYGYRPAAHCFPECGKRKVVAFGRLDPAAYEEDDPWSFFDVLHAAVEVGDSGWLESKFGPEPRLLHKLFDLSGGCMGYGGPIACWERDVQGANPTLCDPGYDPLEDPANQVPAEICDRWGWENYLFCRADFCAQAPDGCPAEDADLDGIPFANDSCPDVLNALEDRDGDGIDDACDNCIDVQNPDQANCDLEFDDAAPSDRRGDACDPDPCAVWHAPNAKPLRSSVEDVGGDAEVGRVAYFSFDGLGGDIDLAAADNYRANETFQDVRPAYCSCAQSQDPNECAEQCPLNVPLAHDASGIGWWIMSREVDGDIVREEMPDIPFVRGGPGGGAGAWRWQQDDCPGAAGQRVDCSTLGNQKFHLWLRPMVDPASWPDGWPDELHNYYAPGEYRLDAIILPNPPPEAEWPGPRFLPEGACFHCDLGFFGEAMLPFVGEFAPGAPLPPYSPYRFAGYSTGDPVQGIAVGLVDPDTVTVRRYIPSIGLTSTHEPRVTGAMVAVAPPAGTGFDATLWLFGGIGAGGVRSSALFRGEVVAGSTPSLDRVVWTRLTPSSAPSGRVGGTFAYEPIRHSLLLWGGLDGAGHALDDFWRFDIATGTWSRDSLRSMPDARPGRRAFGAAGQDGQFVYVYGGQRTDGAPLDDLYRVDLVSGIADLVDQSCSGGGAMLRSRGGQFLAGFAIAEDQEPFPAALDAAWDDALGSLGDGLAALTSSFGPGPRSAADLAVEPDHRGLLLYGGVATAGTSNELWRFDLQTHCWERLSGPCIGGSCQPAGSQALAAGAWARTAVVIPSIGGQLQPSIAWHFDPGRAARSPGWVPEPEWARQPAAADCNGDGYPDTGAGFACATSTSWYDGPGARGCTEAGAVACPQVTASLDGLYSLSATSPVKIAARGETLVVSSGSWVLRYRLVGGAAPVLTGAASLSGSAVGIVLDGSRAFVATTNKRVQAFSLAGSWITYQGQRTFSSAIGAIGGDGNRVYVASGNRLWVLDGSSATLPTIGSTTLPQTSCSALAVVGRRVVVANGTVVVVVSVVLPSAPSVQGSVTIGSGTTALRGMGQRVYAIKSGLNYVIDVSNPSVPALVGMHDALEWARGAQYVGDHAVRVAGTSLVQVAEIEP